MRSRSLPVLVLPAVLLACAAPADLRVVAPATPAGEALFARVKALEGAWELAEQPGQVAALFTLSSGGSVVRELMFPDKPEEMTNLYHLDGDELVLTHYCASGNQPRLVARASDGNALDFRLDTISNLTAPDAAYMGALTLVTVDPDTLRAEWKTLQAGKVVPEHSPVFVLTRRK